MAPRLASKRLGIIKLLLQVVNYTEFFSRIAIDNEFEKVQEKCWLTWKMVACISFEENILIYKLKHVDRRLKFF